MWIAWFMIGLLFWVFSGMVFSIFLLSYETYLSKYLDKKVPTGGMNLIAFLAGPLILLDFPHTWIRNKIEKYKKLKRAKFKKYDRVLIFPFRRKESFLVIKVKVNENMIAYKLNNGSWLYECDLKIDRLSRINTFYEKQKIENL